MAETVKTRVLIISDTHCASLSGADHAPDSPFTSPLPKADLLIHSGDLTHTGTIEQYHAALDMLAQIDAPVKLVIAGNHDLSLDQEYVMKRMRIHDQTQAEADLQVKQARDLWTDPNGRAVKEGISYLDEGVHESIALRNGAEIRLYASPYTPEFCGWGFPYGKSEDRFNATSFSDASNITRHPVPPFTSSSPIDLLITHGPPYARMDKTDRGDLAGCPHLLRAVMNSRPLLHCFGHIHEGWGAERISWSPHAQSVAESVATRFEWTHGGWERGVADGGITPVTPPFDDAQKDHAVFIDVSVTSGNGLRKGEETLMVNSAIMDSSYAPRNAPIVVDLDLPKAS